MKQRTQGSMRQRIYFPGLDVIRFYAAFCVLYSHLINTANNLTPHGIFRIIPLELFLLTGLDAVRLFFVISGFLITYLLLVEHEREGAISVPAFYGRRALRIWPLYYLVLVLTLIVLPIVGGWQNDVLWTGGLPLYLIMLPNVAIGLNPAAALLSPYWSIGVEEQFYLIWPWLVKWCAPRRLWALFAAGFVVRAAMIAVMPHLSPTLSYVFNSLTFESMILGGIGALLLFKRSKYLALIFNGYVQVGALTLILAVAVVNGGDYISAASYPFLTSVFYLVAVLNIAANPKSILKLDRLATFQQLGRITYGIYMIHTTVLFIIGRLLMHVQSPFYDVLMYGLGIGLTIGIAALSYKYIEQPILRYKDRLFWIKPQLEPTSRAS